MPEKETVTLNLKPARKRKNPPKTAYSREHPSPNAFQPGQSGNPGGHPRNHRLLSKTARADIARRAPSDVCRALGLPMGSSWGQCLIRSLIRMGVRGDLGAMQTLIELTEPIQRLAQGMDSGVDGEGAGGPQLVVNFVSAEYRGPSVMASDAEGTLVDGAQMLPPPNRD